jgi:hypothetical protein
MEIFDFVLGIVNFFVGILHGILDLIEKIFSPVINLINRWNNLFGG